MKTLFIGLMLLIATPVFASVSGTVIGTQQDENGNIIVKTAYYMDGVNVPSRYPVENGVYYWVSRYSFQNFDGMTPLQIEARIKQDVDAFAQSLIAKKYTTEANASLDLKALVGKTFTSQTAEIQLSPTKALTVNTAGVSVQKVLTPTVEAIAK
jgi:hypothetical protein